jgi:CheY-like chemotaxis protein
VIDDDYSVLGAVADVLASEGYTIFTATSGVEALQEVERCCPKIVLLDLRMPDVGGWDVAREFRARHLALKLVVMTAVPNAEGCAAEVHADGYLAKPFERPHLLGEVERLCAAIGPT